MGVYPNAVPWVAGQPGQLKPETKMVISTVMPLLINRMLEEEDKEVCAQACNAVYTACKNFGPSAVMEHIDEVYKAMLELVAEKSPCQQNYDDDDPENAEHDEVLIDSVTDVVGVLAQ